MVQYSKFLGERPIIRPQYSTLSSGVTFTLLEDIFNEFAPQALDYEFSRSKVHVKLLGEKYISRSEARRLLVNLEKFKHIDLDFKNVESVGQGFADEVFRVFSSDHPGIVIRHGLVSFPALRETA